MTDLTSPSAPEGEATKLTPSPSKQRLPLLVAVTAILALAAGFGLGHIGGADARPCHDALSQSDKLLAYSADGSRAAADALSSVVSNDLAGIEDATTRLKKLNDQINATQPLYLAARDACNK